jgi:hypothetical protein
LKDMASVANTTAGEGGSCSITSLRASWPSMKTVGTPPRAVALAKTDFLNNAVFCRLTHQFSKSRGIVVDLGSSCALVPKSSDGRD